MGSASLTCLALLAAATSWDGEVRVYGELRAMMHEGRTEAAVALDALLPNANLYALGALADLAGEITIVGGKAHLSYAGGMSATRPGAALLVASEVSAWSRIPTEHSIRFEDLDAEIGKLAAQAGIRADARFPFLLEGELEDLQWHVIDGKRLQSGTTSHQDHLAAADRERRDRARAVLVGFYSDHDQGVFTHMGSRTHVHCVLDEPSATGHVDHVVLPKGTRVSFPRAAPAR